MNSPECQPLVDFSLAQFERVACGDIYKKHWPKYGDTEYSTYILFQDSTNGGYQIALVFLTDGIITHDFVGFSIDTNMKSYAAVQWLKSFITPISWAVRNNRPTEIPDPDGGPLHTSFAVSHEAIADHYENVLAQLRPAQIYVAAQNLRPTLVRLTP